jgi:hypothetical protein
MPLHSIRPNFRPVSALVVFVSLALSGCGSSGLFGEDSSATVLDRDGLDVVLDRSDKQAYVFKDTDGTERFCRSPAPDFAVTASEGVSLGVSGRGVGEDASEGALGLGGRNPEVLVARELLYRACELSLNLNADPKTTRAIYTQFLNAIKDIAKSQSGAGDAALGAKANDARIKLPARAVPVSNNNDDDNDDDDSDNNSNSSGNDGFR